MSPVPAEVKVSRSSVVTLPSSVMLPVVAPVVIAMSLPAAEVVRLPVSGSVPSSVAEPEPSSPAVTVISAVAVTGALIVISSSASIVTVVGSTAASIEISSAASSRMVPDPVSLALISMLPVTVPAVIVVSPTILTVPLMVMSLLEVSESPAPAELATLTTVADASVMATAPDPLNSREPKLTVAESPSVMLVPARSA